VTASTARVVRLLGPRQLTFEPELLPPLVDGDLLCQTLVTALSPGTEVAAYQGLPPLREGPQYPRVQGYCNVARVLESRDPRTPAGSRVLSFTSHRDRFILSGNEVLYRLPEDADAGLISTAYLFHLGYNAVLRAGVRPGSRVVVIGMGALGLASVAMAALAGAEVRAVTDHPAPAALARALGACSAQGRSPDLITTEGFNNADVIISTVNGWDDWRLGLSLAGQNGVIACLGFPGRGQPAPKHNPFDPALFYMKQLRIEAVGWSPETNDSRGFLRFNERDNLAWIASQIQQGRLDASALVSARYPAEDIEQAYLDLLARENSPITYLLEWAR
jgi:threonine dehydrogenase-like Zn-dependent dehydrogenase